MIWYLHVSLIVSQNSPHSLIFSHVCAQSLSYVHFATPGTVARQAPLSMGFPRQEHWSGLPFLTPGDLPDPGIKHIHLLSLSHWQVALYPCATWEAPRFQSWSFDNFIPVRGSVCREPWLFAVWMGTSQRTQVHSGWEIIGRFDSSRKPGPASW